MNNDEPPQKDIIFSECLTLGLIKTLEDTPGVQGVELAPNQPCERLALTTWEQRHSCILPADLRNFYHVTDGFKLIWNYEYAGEILPIGNMKINSINELKRIGGFKVQEDSENPSPLDIDLCHQQARALQASPGKPGKPQQSSNLPNFGTKYRVFELDPCQGLGKVSLVYQQQASSTVGLVGDQEEPNIWLLDRCFEWHFLAENFTTYFRMMLVHKGLPQWQFKFTPIGLTPWAEQMFVMLAPGLLLQPDRSESSPTREQDEFWDAEENLLDPAIFKLRSKTSKTDQRLGHRDDI